MKLSPGFRIVLYLFLLAIMALCAFLLVLEIQDPASMSGQLALLSGILDEYKQLVLLLGLGFIFIVAFILLIWSIPKASGNNNPILISQTDDGSITEVTIDAVTAMVHRHCMTYRSVAGCVPRVSEQDRGGVNIRLRLRPVVDAELPALSEKLRASLTSTISREVGIPVHNVSIIYVAAVDKRATRDNN